ncbi:MAG: hypothetical protein COB08_003035, partial [Rhodobacteraceae bacterium]|nr:hypothetical protein [Paracoccaceae bacterium]
MRPVIIAQFGKKFLLFLRILVSLVIISLAMPGVQSAKAAADGTRGWGWNGIYYGSASEACVAQWNWAGMNNGLSRFIGALTNKNYNWWNKVCSWTSFQYLCPLETGGGVFSCWTVLPTIVSFSCEAGYTRVFPFQCVKDEEYQAQRPPQCNATTPNPVILRDGTKYRFAEDFTTSDGKLSVSRTYRSKPVGRNTSLVSLPLGLSRGWQFNFEMELHIGETSGSPSSPNANVTLVAPDGSAYDFYLNGSGDWVTNLQSGSVSSDYSLEYVGSLPSALSTLKDSVSNWIVTGPDDKEWSLETLGTVNDQSIFDMAQPTSVVDRMGYTWTYSYGATDRRLLSIVDTYNRSFQFEWNYFYITTVPNVAGSLDVPEAIKAITLPDGTKVTYEYDPAPAGSAPSTSQIERLIKVGWQDSTSVEIDKLIYHYEDTDFPQALTGITDNRNIRFATYAYDNKGRVVSTVGVGGSDSYTIEYGV